MSTVNYFFEQPSLEAISSIKLFKEVAIEGLFYLHPHDLSDLKLLLLVGNHLIQYEVLYQTRRTTPETTSEDWQILLSKLASSCSATYGVINVG